jgi:hypothetical protein
MKIHKAAFLLACVAGAAHAQESNFDMSVGLRAWNAQWTTFSYGLNFDGTAEAITQAPMKDKVLLIPVLTARYRDFTASLSGFAPTTFDSLDGEPNRRKEFEVNLGWLFIPGVAATIGYKRLGQFGDGINYDLGGPTIGLTATAPIRGAAAMYGGLGLGRLKSTSGSIVKFDADYQLVEVGLAYSVGLDAIAKAVTFTLGYRVQVLSSKDALDSQDARDLTQGFTLGVLARF